MDIASYWLKPGAIYWWACWTLRAHSPAEGLLVAAFFTVKPIQKSAICPSENGSRLFGQLLLNILGTQETVVFHCLVYFTKHSWS